MKQYVQTDLEADRQVANTLAELIIRGAGMSLPGTGFAVGARLFRFLLAPMRGTAHAGRSS